jgi:hypothetical protein
MGSQKAQTLAVATSIRAASGDTDLIVDVNRQTYFRGFPNRSAVANIKFTVSISFG